MAADKLTTPAYCSPKSLKSFFDARRDDGHITTVVDRSLMSTFSGSTANELLAGLKFLKLIKENGQPLPAYGEYVKADDATRKALLNKLLRSAYTFVFDNPGFGLERGTSAQIAEAFRAQSINGSTLSRAISFFLSVAKDAEIKVSPNIKAPTHHKANGSPRAKKDSLPPAAQTILDEPPATHGVQHFDIPIPINRKVRISIPTEWSAKDWDLFQTMLTAYIEGWKSMPAASGAKDKGPTPIKE